MGNQYMYDMYNHHNKVYNGIAKLCTSLVIFTSNSISADMDYKLCYVYADIS